LKRDTAKRSQSRTVMRDSVSLKGSGNLAMAVF
jgi:hypothetical protein